MGPGASAARGTGGGEIVPAPRKSGPRLTAGLASCAIFGAVAAYAAASAGANALWVALPGAVALALLALGIWRSWSSAVPLAVTLVGGGWAASLLLEDRGVDGAAPAIAAGLLVACELAYWATAARAVPADAGLMRRQAAVVAALAAVSLCLGTLLLLVGGASVRGGLSLEALGVAAAIAALAVVARLART